MLRMVTRPGAVPEMEELNFAVLLKNFTLNGQGDTRLQQSDFGIFCVIVNRCTFSTPHSASLKMPKSDLPEVEESDSSRLRALQGA